MYNITPIEYLSAIPKEITLGSETIDTGYRWVEILNINGTTFDLHEGRKFKVYSANDKSVTFIAEYQKRISKTGTETKYLVFPDSGVSFMGLTVIAYGTFPIDKDNQAITLMDVYNRVKPIIGNINEYGYTTHSGKAGLISGVALQKLQEKLKVYFLLNDSLPLTNNNTELCRVKLNRGNLNQIRLTICGTVTLNLDLKIKYVSDSQYINTLHCGFLNEYTANWDQKNVKFSVAIQKYNNNSVTEEWAILSWKGTSFTGAGYKLFVEVPNIEATQPKGASVGTPLNLTWNKQDIPGTGIFMGEVIEIPITQQLSYIDNNSVKFDVYVGETNNRQLAITPKKDLNTLVPGNYYYTPAGIKVSELANIPSGITDSFTVQCIKTGLSDITATYILITKRGTLYYGYKENNIITWVTTATSGHTHYAKEIRQDENNRFVSDAWINSINKGLNDVVDTVKNTLWTATGYSAKSKLPAGAIPGTNAVVFADETNNGAVVNYLYDGNTWIPTSINALKVVTLTSNSGLMSSDMLKRLNASEKQFMMGVGTNWQRLENIEKSYLSDKNRVLDFAYRGTEIGNYSAIGDDSIIFGNGPINVGATKSFVVGFNSATIDGEYQVALGEGLEYSGTLKNITLFGKYNLAEENILFAYGIGASADDRKNAFWLSKVGDEYFVNTMSGYKIQGKGADDVVLSDGTTFPKSSIPSEQKIMDTIMAYLESALSGDKQTDIIRFLDYSGNTYENFPVIQPRWESPIKYMVETWDEFKTKAALIKLPLDGNQILFVGYPTQNSASNYTYIAGGISDESTGAFTKENENWCISDNIGDGASLPPVGDAKSFEGALFILSTDQKIYRFNAGKLNTTGANTWEYFGKSIQ